MIRIALERGSNRSFLFNPLMKKPVEMPYLAETPVILDDTKLKQTLGRVSVDVPQCGKEVKGLGTKSTPMHLDDGQAARHGLFA